MRMLRMYGCMIMIRTRLMKDVGQIRKILENRKKDAELIYSKMMAAMGTKCYKQITVETAQEVKWKLL